MIDVYFWPTPNGRKITIMLEECDMPYTIVPVDIGGGDQFKPEFLRICPNNRMPAIIDNEPLGGGEPLSIFESGAIMEYLAEKSGKFLPKDPAGKYAVLQWVHWQMANLGPMMGNANHFKNYAKTIVDDESKLEYGQRRFIGEVDRLAGVMDTQLSIHPYLAGTDYSIADMITWPWAMFLNRLAAPEGSDGGWDAYPNVKRWVDAVGSRDAVKRGQAAGSDLGKQELTKEQEEARRKLLFNQTNESVRAAREAALKG
ncbi:MAG: glutathione S-transferase N-terminal domain-containing protein [Parvibaculaceae bacterium]|nr:glutathione S-transferase N-terminal domain-containing protein [Parvibaculaceae bacterium]HBM88061.1 thiol:disulfide oxidoreductase [Rhodobiaceae bacterium]